MGRQAWVKKVCARARVSAGVGACVRVYVGSSTVLEFWDFINLFKRPRKVSHYN